MSQSPDLVEITAESTSVAQIPPNPAVGRIYEVGINGVGYMLSDSPEQPDTQPQTVVPNLQSPRLATTDTPFSQAVERYSFEVFHDWSAGMGQRWLNRQESTSRAFQDSEGIDPFSQPGEISLLPATSKSLTETFEDIRLVVVGDDAYALTDDDALTRLVGSTGLWGTEFTLTDGAGITAVTDLTSDGQYWYAAYDGTGILRGTTTDPAAAWSTQNAVSVRWAAGRIMAAVIASGSTPNRLTSLGPAGTEELAGGHLTLDAGHTIILGGVASGHFYFGSYVGDQGQVWAWQLGVDSEGNFHAPYVAWDMPQGLIPTAVDAFGGDVWVRAYRPEGPSSGQASIYRGVPSGGLTPLLVADLGVAPADGAFAEVGDLVVFSWEDTGNDSALGAVSLASGGYCRWLLAHEEGEIRSIVEWQGREMFTVAGEGVYVRSTSVYEASGWLTTSIIDGASLLDKILDSTTIQVRPLIAGESIQIEYTLDGNITYTTAGSLATAGAQRAQAKPDVRAGTFGFRLTLAAMNGASKTTGYALQAKFHPLGLRDIVTRVRVKAYDNMTGLNGAPLPENAKGQGARILRTLETMGQTRILFQDIDWHLSQTAHVYEVVSVETSRVSVYDASRGENSVGGDAVLTLRRAT